MPLRHVALALLVVSIWGFNFVVIKMSVTAFPPLLAAALRFLLAALPLVFLLRPPRTSWKIVVGYGLSFGFALYLCLNLALAWGMPAGLASLVLQVQAFFTMALAFFLLGERPRRMQVLGAAVAFAGIAVIGFTRLAGAGIVPLLLTLAAALAWGLANVLTRKAGRINALAYAAWGSLAAAPPLLALSLAVEGPQAIDAAFSGFGWREALILLFLAYPGTLLGGAIWSWLLGRHSATVVAPFTLLAPVVGMASGYFVLGEMVTPVEIAGALLVIAGLIVTLLRRRTPAPELVP